MQNILRNVVMASVAVAAIAVGAVSASAESVVKVPFAFKVGNKVCPAGEYVIQDGVNHNLVMLQSRDAKVNFAWVLMPGDGSDRKVKASLSFDRVGETELLKFVQYGDHKTSVLDKGSKSMERPITHIIQGQ